MKRSVFPKSTLALACAAFMTTGASGAYAQLEEVVVTATKREESLKDVAMSVEVVSGDELMAAGITNFAALSDQIPNFFVGDGVVTTNVSMRGTGSGGDRSFEQSVGMFIDNIYMPRSRQYRSPFFDADRVEVLRGPQAVLFGLNSTAGAVAIHTARTRPGDDMTADVTLGYETQFEGTRATVVLGGSPTDTLGVRFAAEYSDSDGFYKNTFTGQEEGDREANLYRISVVWAPSDQFEVDVKYESAEFDVSGNHGEIYGGPAAALDGGDGKLDWRRSMDASLIGTYPGSVGNNGVEPGLYQQNDNLSVKADWSLGEHTLTAIYGYSDTEFEFGLDLDSTAGSLVAPLNGQGFVDASITPETYEQSSYELRLTSPVGGTFEYLAGVYYQDSEFFNNNESSYGLTATLDALVFPGACEILVPGFPLCGLNEYQSNRMRVDQELLSFYGNVTWNVSDVFRVTAGVRYAEDKKSAFRDGDCDIYDPASGSVLIPGFLACATFNEGIARDRKSDNTMPELVAEWDVSDDAMLFARIGTSAKSGGFATASSIFPESWEYDDETVVTYELGYKARFGNSAELNAILFRSEYDDLQVNSFITEGANTLGVISNAGQTINQGIEVDGRWAASKWLVLGGSVALLDAEYDSYKTGACYVGEESTVDSSGTICDKTGETPPYSPEFSGTVYADVEFGLTSSVNLVGNVTVAYTDEYFTDGTLDPVALQDSFTRVSASIGLSQADGRWDVSVIGRNLTEEAVLNVTQPLFGYYLGYIGAPRTVTVQATYRF